MDSKVRIYVTSPPVDGEANKAVQELVAKSLKTSKSSVTITKGHTSKDKSLMIEGLSLEAVLECLNGQKGLF